MEYVRLSFWILASLFLIPFVVLTWILLFWVSPDEREDAEDFDDEDDTQEFIRA